MSIKMASLEKVKADLGIDVNGRVQKFFTSECAKAMEKYLPFDTGSLAHTVVFNGQTTSNVKANSITYDTPYAEYVYYGISKDGKPLNYHKDKHDLAGSYWDLRMATAEMDSITKSVNKIVGDSYEN